MRCGLQLGNSQGTQFCVDLVSHCGMAMTLMALPEPCVLHPQPGFFEEISSFLDSPGRAFSLVQGFHPFPLTCVHLCRLTAGRDDGKGMPSISRWTLLTKFCPSTFKCSVLIFTVYIHCAQNCATQKDISILVRVCPLCRCPVTPC